VSVDGDTEVRQLTIRSQSGEDCTLEVDAVFVELGLQPNSSLAQGWVKMNDAEQIVINHATETSVSGLFAAGDVTDVPGQQVLVAIGEGAKAALTAYEYLLKQA